MPRPSTGLNTATRKRPDGTVERTWYHRRTGRLIGKSSEGWTKESAQARAAELDGVQKSGPKAGTFGSLASLYLASPGFKKLAPKTQKGYRAHVELLRTGMGWEDVPIGAISRTVVSAVHARYEDRPWQGNAILRTLRAMMNFGLNQLEMPGLARNPAERKEFYDTPARTQIWDQPRIDAFLAHAAPRVRLAFALLLYTVQRPSDMLALERPSLTVRAGRTWIRLRQAKTDALVDVPCHQRLLAEMKAADTEATIDLAERKRKGQKAANLVLSSRGRAWTYRRFAQAWDLTRRRANWAIAREAIRTMGGLPRKAKDRQEAKEAIRARLLVDLQRRDLRRTGVVQLAVAGATTPEIAALGGWKIDTTQKIVDTYLPRSGQVALGGVEKWEASDDRVVVLGSTDRRR